MDALRRARELHEEYFHLGKGLMAILDLVPNSVLARVLHEDGVWDSSWRDQVRHSLSGDPRWAHLQPHLGGGPRLSDFTRDAEALATREGAGFVYERHLAKVLARDDGAGLRQFGINWLELTKRVAEIEAQEGANEEMVLDPAGAMLDAVTGLGTREFLEEMSRRLVTRCRTEIVPCGVLFIDVDNFKQFNDEHGHDVGDRVLRGVAEVARRALKLRGGVIGRYGGEEIVATIPNMTEEEAAVLGERIRTDAAGLGQNGLGITVSVGVACDVVLASHSNLWQMADTAVRTAKRLGKNRVLRFSQT